MTDKEYEIITGYSKTQLFPCIEYLNDFNEILQTIQLECIYREEKEEELSCNKLEKILITKDNSVLNIDSFVSFFFFSKNKKK